MKNEKLLDELIKRRKVFKKEFANNQFFNGWVECEKTLFKLLKELEEKF